MTIKAMVCPELYELTTVMDITDAQGLGKQVIEISATKVAA